MSKTTREILVDAGERLFARKGFQKTTVGDLEKAAGLSPRAGGFYRHFKSKESLLIEIAARRFETPEKLGLSEMFPLTDTRAELLFIARAYNRLNRKTDRLAHIIRVEASRIPALEKKIKAANDLLFKALCDWTRTKPAMRKAKDSAVSNTTLMIFGAWLFFLMRRQETSSLGDDVSNSFLDQWSEFWARELDNTRK